MAILNDPDDLSQGGSTTVTDAAWGTPSGRNVTITSAGAHLPTIATSRYLEVRSHADARNNGLYITTGTPSTSSIALTKISGSAPIASAASSIVTLGTTADPKNVFFDTAAYEAYLLERGALTSDGVFGQTAYSFAVEEWKNDQFLMDNAPFPMRCIDYDAGKFIMGQDPSGNYNGWDWKDNDTYGIRTRKLLRSCGWKAHDADGNVRAIYSCIKTVGAFEDPDNDTAYYKFGTNQAVNDSVDFTFPGPVNEAILTYDATVCRAVATPSGYTFTDGGASSDTIWRNDGGSFITDGFKVGGRAVVADAEDSGNNGSHLLTGVSASTLTFATGTLGASRSDDNSATIACDNRASFSLYLRVRDADATGKTYASATLASIEEAALTNKISTFPLANASDPKITVSDATIDGSSPYTGMSITYYASPQSVGGGGLLVGGPYNVGIIIDGANGTKEQVNAFVQRKLRQSTDIDAGGGTVIGRCADGLCRFVGDNWEVGSIDGGLTVPTNPLGGGSGVMVINLNAASRNQTTIRDNTGAVRSFPVSVAVTLDVNSAMESDPAAYAWLYFDRTIRNTVSDLVINAAGTFTSAGAHLPATLNRGAGAYVRVSGLTGADAAMNGIYQVTALTSTSQWSVQRRDAKEIVTTSAASLYVDENAFNTPHAIIVQDNTATPVAGDATEDIVAAIDFSANTQGGRVGGTPMYVVGKSIGRASAQYYQGSVITIDGTVPVTIPIAPSGELNYANME